MLKELDNRTEKYFEAIRENKGYIGCNHGWYGIQEILDKKSSGVEAKLIKSYPGYFNSDDINIYEYFVNGNKRYCAELSYQTDIDDFNIETHIFSKFPSEKDVKEIRSIMELEFDFKFNRLNPEFTCWECGHKVHWLDFKGKIQDKIDNLKEKYCGC